MGLAALAIGVFGGGPAQAFVIDDTTAVNDMFTIDFQLDPGQTDNGGNTLGLSHPGLSATVTYTVLSVDFGAGSVGFSINIDNTTSNIVNDAIHSFGFDTDPGISLTSFAAGSVFDLYGEDTNFPSFGTIEFCTWPSQNCSGGAQPNNLAPGNDDTIGLALVWSGGGALTIDPTVVKFQGDAGSFQFAGCEGGDCTTTNVTEPATLGLFSLGLIGLGYVARRRERGRKRA
jgi:hypothetical protein